MKTQEKADVSFSKKRIFQVMTMTAPEQHEATLNNRGFTLVELIVVIGIIGVLATLAIPSYSQLKNSAKIARAESEVRVIDKAVSAFMIDKNRLPNPLSEVGPEGSLKDPWGHSYQYNITPNYKDFIGVPTNEDFDIFSQGADGASDQDLSTYPNCMDDIIRAGSGSTVILGKDL
jgi:general secretion pathway protein G